MRELSPAGATPVGVERPALGPSGSAGARLFARCAVSDYMTWMVVGLARRTAALD